jgi:glutamate formiminotransferase/formiminotetrahydrofolate cyclodeaminase
MHKLIECVPNFSEGRDAKVVDQIVAAILSAGVTLLDREMDANHNRSVITFAGAPEAVEEAAFRGVKKAAELIDLTKHKGEHPRIGATDVVPFVPIAGVTMDDCVAMAKRVASRIATDLNIPTYLYEAAATRPDRANLENIRKGQFEGLRDAIETDPNRSPDFGLKKIHPTAGATAVGARGALIAYNIYLKSNDLALAKEIAKSIRTSGGGFPCVKAMGMNIESRGVVQVSMNLTNFEETSMFTVFEAVREKAAARGVEILSSEIVGLVPQKALVSAARDFLKLENFSQQQVLENKLAAMESGKGSATVSVAKSGESASGTLALPSLLSAIESLANAVAAPTPTPGGGSVSALGGALGAALGEMVGGIALKKCEAETKPRLKQIHQRLAELRRALTQGFHDDAAAYEEVMKALALPKTTDADKERRRAALVEANKGATLVPLNVAKKSLEVMKLLAELRGLVSANMASDLLVGQKMARAGIEGALANVRINLDSIKDAEFVAKTRGEVEGLEAKLKEAI